jgi:EAL domain-containing protein (putative c-di-GMP-specific phosphodiesterase class I)
MMGRTGAQREAASSFVDEIGIEIGIYGDWRLKAAFRPIFAPDGDGFRAVAVEGAMRPFVLGREVDECLFRRAVPQHDRAIVAALQAGLCMRNLEHTGVPGLKLLLEAEFAGAVSPAKARAGVRGLAMEARRCGLAASDVVVRLSRFAAQGSAAATSALDSLQSTGVLIGLDENGEGLALNGLPQSAFPDLVTVDGDWFRSVARQRSTAQLFGTLVHGYRSHGAIVLVQDICTAAELRVALDSGADWLSGPLLAPAALAGAIFPEETLQIESLLDQGRVIPLFRRG